ncbi:MAG: hypothetical protein IKI89_04910, partial [Bacteroidales bacterium]|nr:hypothetical protein [Bacteroidales bacterium]
YVDHRIPFPGFADAALIGDYAGVVDATLRINPVKNFYVSAIAAALKDADRLEDITLDLRPTALGAAVEFSYKTILGPLKATVHWSDFTNRVGAYLSFGYDF